MPTTLQLYQGLINRGILQEDAAQCLVIDELERIACEYAERKPVEPLSLWQRLINHPAQSQDPVKGLYIHGGVGRGKTRLCDLFIEAYSSSQPVQRWHFHRFMLHVHTRLDQLGNILNPVEKVGAEIAERGKIIVLDEMHVNTIVDAMLMSGLLQVLFEYDCTLITTSNSLPEELYKDGLQRPRFLPSIALLEQNCVICPLDSEIDYRLRTLTEAEIFYDSNAATTHQALAARFESLTNTRPQPTQINIQGRELPVCAVSSDVVWFEYDALLNTPRATRDYIEIATSYQSVIVSQIPQLDDFRLDEVRRLINLIDEFYDRHVKLLLSLDTNIDHIYQGTRLAFEFRRCRSRLIEMQSTEYLALAHLQD